MADVSTQADLRAIIDSLGQGVLLFDSDGKLILDNLAARAILGANLPLIRAEGWPAMTLLLDGPREGETPTEQLREQTLRSPAPIRFHTYFNGAYIPCWIATIHGTQGASFTMITIERPDWQALTELMSIFRSEARMSISATRGHAELVNQMLRKHTYDPGTQALAKRISGFTEIISTHMLRLQSLMTLLQRLENIRTGALAAQIRSSRRKIRLSDFIEDFLEEMADDALADPDMGSGDFRDRLIVTIPEHLSVTASPQLLANALRDVLRNAACYSPPDSPIVLQARMDSTRHHVQIDVIDQGYGIRATERDRVFAPFQRARQPQIIGVDGYGLSLYLTKAELEAMGGRIWFDSEEDVGSMFSFKLPVLSPRETAR